MRDSVLTEQEELEAHRQGIQDALDMRSGLVAQGLLRTIMDRRYSWNDPHFPAGIVAAAIVRLASGKALTAEQLRKLNEAWIKV